MSLYPERPWLALYDERIAADTEIRYENALDMFKASVERAGDRPLIHYFESTLTLAEVDRITDAYAVALRDVGVNPGDRVASYLQNVPQFLLTMVASWKVGAIMISINPMWREREIGLVLRDSEAAALNAAE